VSLRPFAVSNAALDVADDVFGSLETRVGRLGQGHGISPHIIDETTARR
jgi:hypothetical protein